MIAIDPYGDDQQANQQMKSSSLNQLPAAQPPQTELELLNDLDAALATNPKNIEALLKRAHLQQGRGDKSKALADYNLILQIVPKFQKAVLERGILLEDMGELEAACRSYTDLVALSPDNVEASKRKCLVLLRMKENSKALIEMNKLLAKGPDVTLYLHRAGLYANMELKNWAIEDYSSAIASDPQNFQAYLGRGRLTQSMDDFANAIRINPNSPVGYVARALASKDIEQAKQDFERALQLQSSRAETLLHRASWGLKQNPSKDSIVPYFTDCEEALKLQPMNPRGYFLRGQIYAVLQDYPSAIVDFFQAMQLGCTDEELYLRKGECHAANDDQDKALQVYSNGIGLNPKSANLYHQRGQLYYKQQMYKSALDDYHRARELDKSHFGARLHLGHLYLKFNFAQSAIYNYTSALQINPDSVEALHGRSVCNMMEKKPEQALQDIAMAVALDESSKNLIQRARVYGVLNRNEQALADYKRAVEIDPGNLHSGIEDSQLLKEMSLLREALGEADDAPQSDLTNNEEVLIKRALRSFNSTKNPNSCIEDLRLARAIAIKPLVQQVLDQAILVAEWKMETDLLAVPEREKQGFNEIAQEIITERMQLALPLLKKKSKKSNTNENLLLEKMEVLREMRDRLLMSQSLQDMPAPVVRPVEPPVVTLNPEQNSGMKYAEPLQQPRMVVEESVAVQPTGRAMLQTSEVELQPRQQSLEDQYQQFVRYLNEDGVVRGLAATNPPQCEYLKAFAKLVYLQVKELTIIGRGERGVIDEVSSIMRKNNMLDSANGKVREALSATLAADTDSFRQLQKRFSVIVAQISSQSGLAKLIVDEITIPSEKKQEISNVLSGRAVLADSIIRQPEGNPMVRQLAIAKKELMTGLARQTIPKDRMTAALATKDWVNFLLNVFNQNERPRHLDQIIRLILAKNEFPLRMQQQPQIHGSRQCDPQRIAQQTPPKAVVSIKSLSMHGERYLTHHSNAMRMESKKARQWKLFYIQGNHYVIVDQNTDEFLIAEGEVLVVSDHPSAEKFTWDVNLEQTSGGDTHPKWTISPSRTLSQFLTCEQVKSWSCFSTSRNEPRLKPRTTSPSCCQLWTFEQ